MNSETNQMLEKLANKLGTTTEYLWGILVSQAKIDAITTIFQYLIIAIFGIVLYKLNKRFRIEKDNYTTYEKHDYIGFIMASCFGIWCILSFIAFLSIGNTVNGLLNPEYWALNEILESIKTN